VIVAEQAMRVAGEAIARQAGIENGDLAAGTASPPMMMTSSMVISSVLWMEGVGLGMGVVAISLRRP